MGFALEKVSYTTELRTITCGECGTPFAMEATLYEKRLRLTPISTARMGTNVALFKDESRTTPRTTQ